MAGADYRHCDVCGCKAFYDANLDYGDYTYVDEDGDCLPLHNCGAWLVLCQTCARAYVLEIIPRAVAQVPQQEEVDDARNRGV